MINEILVFGRLSPPAKAAVFTAGAISGVVVGAIAFIGAIGFFGDYYCYFVFIILISKIFQSGKKGFEVYQRVQQQKVVMTSSNPLYTPPITSGTNALYAAD